MNIIKLIIMICVGGIAGYQVPQLAQQLIDYKGKQKNKEMPVQTKYLSLLCKVLCASGTALGLGVCAYFNPSWFLLICSVVIWIIGMVVLIVDMRIRIIANETVLALFVLGIVLRIANAGVKGLLNGLLTMIVIMFVWIILARFIGFGSVGAGDVKLCGVMGFMFGFPGVSGPLLVMAIGMIVFCGVGMLLRKINRYSMLPMGPFIAIGLLSGLPCMFYMMI